MAAVCVLLSCEKNMTDTGGVPMPCDGNISISFNTGTTKAGDGTELTEEEKKAGFADGSLFTDLWLWIVHDSTNELRYFAHITDDIDAVENYEYSFEKVERGNYTLYAVANYSNKLERFNPYIPEYTYTDQSGTKTNPSLPWKDAIDAEFTKFTLAEIEDDPNDGLDGPVPPTVEKNDGRMPLSIVKHFSVAAGDNYIQAPMTRVCGRLSITVRNLSPDYKIAISNLKLSRHNPRSAFLFSDNHSVPDMEPFYDRFIEFKKDNDKKYAMIQPMQESEILSQLMYETGQDISIGLELDGAVFKADSDDEPEVKDSETVTKCSVGNSEAPQSGKNYVLKSLSNSNFLHVAVSDSEPSMTSLMGGDSDGLYIEAEINRCMWRYSGSSTSGTLVNVGDGRGLTRTLLGSLGLASTPTEMTISQNSPGYSISVISVGSLSYFIKVENNSLGFELKRNNNVNDNKYRWQFLPVTSREVEVPVTPTITNGLKKFSYKTDEIKVLDKYGSVVPLSHICRNQDVRIILNVSYNPVSGTFDYVIEPWEERDMGAEFD